MKLLHHHDGATCLLPGYTAFNGHVFMQHECDVYNRFTNEIIAERYPATIKFLLDQRHRCLIQIINTKDEKEG